MADEPDYSTIRKLVGHIIGQTVVDITQHDEEEFKADGKSYIMLMFSGGDYLKVYVGEGIIVSEP